MRMKKFILYYVILIDFCFASMVNGSANVNDVTDFFDKNIVNKKGYMEDLESIKNIGVENIKDSLGIENILEINKSEPVISRYNSMDSANLDKYGDAVRKGLQYEFYDRGNFETDLNDPTNITYRQDVKKIVNLTNQIIKKLSTRLDKLNVYCDESEVSDLKREEKGVCKEVPCLDGNCVDKSYLINSEMVHSIAQLDLLSQVKNDNGEIQIFTGKVRDCKVKRPANFSNCCPGGQVGWGQRLGYRCSRDEKDLIEKIQKNLCVYVTKRANRRRRVVRFTTSTTHFYCCFNSVLEKIIQIQGRRQLGISFEHNGNINCRGLTMEELNRINMENIDFSEFTTEVQSRIVPLNISDTEMRIKDSLIDINKFDQTVPLSNNNKKSGINTNVYK